MKRSIIIVDHEDGVEPQEIADVVGEQMGVDDVSVADNLIMLASGNPFEGLALAGPFDSGEDAEEFGETYQSSDWWIVTVEPQQK